jgi:hypothetical protein
MKQELSDDKALMALREYGHAEYRDGYRQGLLEMHHTMMTLGVDACEKLLGKLCDPRPEPGPAEPEEPGPAEPEPDLQAKREQLCRQLTQRRQQLAQTPRQLSPALADALTYLQNHPGVTAWTSRHVIHQACFYRLRDLGLARQDGSSFYAVDAAPAPRATIIDFNAAD